MKENVKKTLKYVCSTVWKTKPWLYLVYFGRLLCRLCEIFQIVILPKFLVDEVVLIVSRADFQTHIRNAIFYAVLNIIVDFVASVLSSGLNHYITYASEYYDEYANLQIYNKTMSMDFEYTEDPEILNKMNNAKEGISWYSGGIRGLCDQFFNLVSGFVSCCTVSAVVLWKCPVLLPVLFVCIALASVCNRISNNIEVKQYTKLGRINRLFGYYCWELSAPQYGKDIRLYNTTDQMIEKADGYNKEITDIFHGTAVERRKWNYVTTLIDMVRNIISYTYIGWKAVKRVFTIGDISMLISAFGNLYNYVREIVVAFQEISKRCVYFNNFLTFLDYPETKSLGTEKVQEKDHVIEFRHVYFKYPRSEKNVLEDVNITLKAGEHLSVVGLNGAGKTTFIKLLCRLYDVTSGEILIDGINIKDYDEEEYKKLFSVVFQDFKIFAFSLKENIALAQKTQKMPLEGEALEEKLGGILKQTGLYDDVEKLPLKMDTHLSKSYDEQGTEFSGGQKQKTAISRALFRNSPVVILDEPTAALDPIAEYEIYRQFNTLVGGKTAVYISHRLSSCRFCDKIAVFSEGTIKEYGSHDELVNKEGGLYAQMFAEQAKYYA